MSENSIKASNAQLWRGALIPAALAGGSAITAATIFHGKSGLYGGLLGFMTVIIFFSINLFVAHASITLNPMLTMALAFVSYFAKIILLAVFLFAVTKLTSPETVDRLSFGASALVVTLAWLGGEIRAFLKLRLHLPLPSKQDE